MPNTISNPVQELLENVSTPFTQARAMPKSVYTTKEFLNYELENIFKKDWFCAGRSDALKNIGDYLTLELAGQPIMVIRDNDSKIRAQSNVCRQSLTVSWKSLNVIKCPAFLPASSPRIASTSRQGSTTSTKPNSGAAEGTPPSTAVIT